MALFGEECLCQKIRYLKFIFSPKDNSCPHSFLYLRYDVKCHSAVMVFQWRDIVVSYGQLCSGIDLNKIKKFIRHAVGCCKRAKLYRAFKSFLYITIGLRRCHRQLLSWKRSYKFKKNTLKQNWPSMGYPRMGKGGEGGDPRGIWHFPPFGSHNMSQFYPRYQNVVNQFQQTKIKLSLDFLISRWRPGKVSDQEAVQKCQNPYPRGSF